MCSFKTGSSCMSLIICSPQHSLSVHQASFKLMDGSRSLPPECWDYRQALSCLACTAAFGEIEKYLNYYGREQRDFRRNICVIKRNQSFPLVEFRASDIILTSRPQWLLLKHIMEVNTLVFLFFLKLNMLFWLAKVTIFLCPQDYKNEFSRVSL